PMPKAVPHAFCAPPPLCERVTLMNRQPTLRTAFATCARRGQLIAVRRSRPGPPHRRLRSCVSRFSVGGDMQFTRGRLVPIILSAFLALPALLASQEPVTITGKVTSDAGQPLGQVEVAIASMGLGGLTRDDGSYSIVVPGARVSGQTVTLAARRLGYKSQTAQVTLTPGGVTPDFVLAANPLQLSGV